MIIESLVGVNLVVMADPRRQPAHHGVCSAGGVCFEQILFSNSGSRCESLHDILAEPTVLSAVGRALRMMA